MKAHWQYLSYVIRHKWFVLVAGLRLGVPIWQLITHDWSKFTPSEWPAYVRWFQVKDRSAEAKAAFDAAWDHHWMSNPHHWQYWLMWDKGQTTALDMSFRYIIEMLCDWTAMSYKFGDTPGSFYDKSKANMLLSESTVLAVEGWLPLFNNLVKKQRREPTDD